MTFLLRVDGPRWRGQIDAVLSQHDDPAAGGLVIPVAKSNGYGLGQALVAHEMTTRGRPVLSVGTVFEAIDPLLAWQGDVLVLTPWALTDSLARPAWEAAQRQYGPRLMMTLADVASLRAVAAAADAEHPVRVLLEGLTSVRRFGFTEAELVAALRDPLVLAALESGAVKVCGLALHLPMVVPDLGSDQQFREASLEPVVAGGRAAQAVRWSQFWLARIAELPVSPDAAQVWVSHLTGPELQQVRKSLPDVPVHPRIGTALWLGDPASVTAHGVVLAVHPAGSGGAGYFQHRVPAGGHLVIVGGGTSHGVALSGPIGAATLRRRVSVVGSGLLDAAGRPVSPYRWQGHRLRFLEAPHASVSLVLVGKGVPPPAVGEELPCQLRLTTARFDAVVGLD